MEKESKEKIDKNEKKALKKKEKQEKKEAKIKLKQEKKIKNKKSNKKVDKFTIFSKLLAAFLVIFTIGGACYSCIYYIMEYLA